MLIDAALFLSRNRVHRNHTFRAVQVHNLATGVIALLVVSFLVATMTFLAITEAGKRFHVDHIAKETIRPLPKINPIFRSRGSQRGQLLQLPSVQIRLLHLHIHDARIVPLQEEPVSLQRPQGQSQTRKRERIARKTTRSCPRCRRNFSMRKRRYGKTRKIDALC